MFAFTACFCTSAAEADPGFFIGEGLQVLGAPFWPGGAVSRGAIVGEKAPFRAKRASLLAGGEYLLRRASLWAKRAPFRIRRAPSLAGRRTYNAFDAKIEPGLIYSANGDENCRPCAKGAGASVSIGEELPAPAACPWIRP